MTAHSADPSRSRIAGVAAPPGRCAAGNDDDITTTTPRHSPATAADPDAVIREAPSGSDSYIYGYDSAGNPTLTDAGGYYRFSDNALQE